MCRKGHDFAIGPPCSARAHPPHVRCTRLPRSTQYLAALLDWEAARTGNDLHAVLWTALIVIYARPFTESRKIGRIGGRQWAQFADERLTSTHTTLLAARNRDASHTEDVEL